MKCRTWTKMAEESSSPLQQASTGSKKGVRAGLLVVVLSKQRQLEPRSIPMLLVVRLRCFAIQMLRRQW